MATDPNNPESSRADEVARLRARIRELESQCAGREGVPSSFAQSLPGFIYRCRNDQKWTAEYLSEAFFDVTGYRPEEVVGSRILSYGDLVLPEHRQGVWEGVQRGIAERCPYQMEYPIRAADGQVKWVWERGRGIFDAEGKLLCLEGYIEDITALWEARAGQRASEALVRSIGDNLPGAMLYQIIRDRDGNRRLTFLSDGVRTLYGCSPGEGLADPGKIYGRVHEEDRRRLWEEEEKAFRAMKPFRAEVRMVAPDGRPRWSLFASSPRLIEDGSTCWDGVELDITESKRAQERLAETEALVGSISNNLPDACLYQASRASEGGEWTLGFVSEGVRSLFGVTPEEALADMVGFYAKIVPEDRGEFWAAADEAFRTRSPFRAQVRIQNAERGLRWLQFTSSPRTSAEGTAYWDGIALDITERKLAEERLRESEALLRSISDHLPSGVLYQAVRNADGSRRLTYLSEGIRSICGCSPEAVMASSELFYGRILQEDRQAFWEEGERSFRTRLPFSAQVRLDTAACGVRWFHFTSTPRPMPDGTIRWNGVGVDITERKLAEEKLRESEARFRAIFEMAGIFLVVVDNRGRVLEINDHFLKMLGYSHEEAKLQDSSAVTHPEDREISRRTFGEVFSGKVEGARFEKRYLPRAGGEVWVDLSVMPLRDGSGAIAGLIGAGVDITDRKRSEEALRRLLEERETLLRELYHRTKNNMQVIMALMDRQASALPDEGLKEVLGEMKGRIAAMALVHQMLYQGKSLSRVNLGEYIQSLSGLLEGSLVLFPGHIRLSVDVRDVLVPLESAVPCGLILNELITNAVKHAFPEGRAGEIRVGLRGAEGGWVHLEVSDDGVGIPEDLDLARVRTLGLWTVNLLVRQVGGQLALTRGRGVCWKIRFPAGNGNREG